MNFFFGLVGGVEDIIVFVLFVVDYIGVLCN